MVRELGRLPLNLGRGVGPLFLMLPRAILDDTSYLVRRDCFFAVFLEGRDFFCCVVFCGEAFFSLRCGLSPRFTRSALSLKLSGIFLLGITSPLLSPWIDPCVSSWLAS